MYRLGAVVSHANRDALGVDELAHIVRMHAGHVERHGADAVHVFARPEDANAIDVAELEQFGGDGLLMGFDVLEPDVHHPFGGDACGYHLG